MPRLKEWFCTKPPHTPPYVLEDMETVRPRRLLSTFGIDWMANPSAWVAPLWMLAVGIVIGLVADSHASAGNGCSPWSCVRRIDTGQHPRPLLLGPIFTAREPVT
jgi:hypothetical protein